MSSLLSMLADVPRTFAVELVFTAITGALFIASFALQRRARGDGMKKPRAQSATSDAIAQACTAGKIETAMSLFDAAVAVKRPLNAAALRGLTVAALRMGEWATLIRIIRTVTATRSDLENIVVFAIRGCEQARRFDETLELYRCAAARRCDPLSSAGGPGTTTLHALLRACAETSQATERTAALARSVHGLLERRSLVRRDSAHSANSPPRAALKELDGALLLALVRGGSSAEALRHAKELAPPPHVAATCACVCVERAELGACEEFLAFASVNDPTALRAYGALFRTLNKRARYSCTIAAFENLRRRATPRLGEKRAFATVLSESDSPLSSTSTRAPSSALSTPAGTPQSTPEASTRTLAPGLAAPELANRATGAITAPLHAELPAPLYGMACEAFVRRGCPEDAAKLLEEDEVELNPVLLSTLLRGWCAKGDAERAAELMRSAPACCLDLVTYGVYIKFLCESARTAQAIQVLDEMRLKHVSPDLVLFNMVLAACAETDAARGVKLWSHDQDEIVARARLEAAQRAERSGAPARSTAAQSELLPTKSILIKLFFAAQEYRALVELCADADEERLWMQAATTALRLRKGAVAVELVQRSRSSAVLRKATELCGRLSLRETARDLAKIAF